MVYHVIMHDVPNIFPNIPRPETELSYRSEIIQECQSLADRMRKFLGSSEELSGRVDDREYSIIHYPDGMCELEFSYGPSTSQKAFLQIRPDSVDGFFPGSDMNNSLSFFTDSQSDLLSLRDEINTALTYSSIFLSQLEVLSTSSLAWIVRSTTKHVDNTLAT